MELAMTEIEKIDKLEEIIVEVDLKVSLLNSALKFPDECDLNIYAVRHCVEDIYEKLKEVWKFF